MQLSFLNVSRVEDYQWRTAPQMIDGLALGETTPGPLIMVVPFVGFADGWIKAISGLDALFLFRVNAMAGSLHSIRIEHPKRPDDQTRKDQTQQKCREHPTLRVPQTLTPCEIYPDTLASPTDVFPIPILMAIVACNGRATGGTNTRHIRTVRKIGIFDSKFLA